MAVELPRRFVLLRHDDPDGTAVLRWSTEHRSTGVYAGLGELKAVHLHHGGTEIVWLDE